MKYVIHSLFICGVSLGIGCASGRSSSSASRSGTVLVREELPPEDQEKFKDLREAVPHEVNGDDDILSLFVLSLDQRVEPPTDVKEKFETLIRKVRHQFSTHATELREQIRAEDAEAREGLAIEQKRQQIEFDRIPKSRNEKRAFQKVQEKERVDLEKSLSYHRRLVERDISELAQKLEETIRRHSREFSSRYAEYAKSYHSQQQSIRREKAEESRRMNQVPATPIGAGN